MQIVFERCLNFRRYVHRTVNMYNIIIATIVTLSITLMKFTMYIKTLQFHDYQIYNVY